MILADGMMGQMMEPVVFKEPKHHVYAARHMMRGVGGGTRTIIGELPRDPMANEEHNVNLDC